MNGYSESNVDGSIDDGQRLLRSEDMSISVVVIDYSRPVQAMFDQPSRAGMVHSVFRRAVNVAVDGTILSLLSDELPRMPNGVRLLSVVVEELRQGLRPGMEVWVGGGRLFVPDCDFSLGLPETPPWEPRPNVEEYRWEHETVAGNVRLVAGYVGQDQPTKPGRAPSACFAAQGIAPTIYGQSGDLWDLFAEPQKDDVSEETILWRMTLPRLRLLARASWRQDLEGVEEATRRLAGLGPGLTPTGDDVLAGFAAVMVLLSAKLSVDSIFRGQVAEIIARVALPRTTMLSGVLLEYAARGEVAEQVGNLLLALVLPEEESEAVLRAVDGLLAYGATSGRDTLLGILLGLWTLEGESTLKAMGAGKETVG
jgi:hypothetical protein